LLSSTDGRWDPAYHFTPEGLGKASNNYTPGPLGWRDHALYFQGPRPNRRGWINVAIVGQPYAGADCRAELAELERQGFRIHTPPRGGKASIWFPGQTLFIVVTLPSVEVKWLPEQS
jgi:hypothetical protein